LINFLNDYKALIYYSLNKIIKQIKWFKFILSKKIGIINFGAGNYRSVCNMMNYLNEDFLPITSKSQLKNVSHIILPGVGSYDFVVNSLKNLDLFDEIKNKIQSGSFYLGICVGMQILSSYGVENVTTDGYNLIKGSVEKIKTKKYSLPNIGWHKVKKLNDSQLFKDISEKEMIFYFIHSYHYKVQDFSECSSIVYYEEKIAASVEKENVFGVQFHPEKSQAGGIKVLKNFCNL
jgi:imidazole glycerol-phosphate synthase subunit HisH